MIDVKLLKEYAELSNKLADLVKRTHREELNGLCSDGKTPICNYQLEVSVQDNRLAIVGFSFGERDSQWYDGKVYPEIEQKPFIFTLNDNPIDVDTVLFPGPLTIPESTPKTETSIAIAEAFEDFLDDRDITITNPDRADNPEEGQARIYGSDWDELKERIDRILQDHDYEIAEELNPILESLENARKLLTGDEE